jgi:hypothetical protein
MDEETSRAEILLREEEPAGRDCPKCQRPLLESEKKLCAACKQKRMETLGMVAKVAMVIVMAMGTIVSFIYWVVSFPFRKGD